MNDKHTCYYCKSPAIYVSVRYLGQYGHTYYFYCERHKTPHARPIQAAKKEA